jgi:carbon storage regulator CsrA
MLVLTRKSDQAIVVGSSTDIGSLLKITVLSIGHGTVRLGFEVDASVPVHRWEVWQRIQVENRLAGSTESSAGCLAPQGAVICS